MTANIVIQLRLAVLSAAFFVAISQAQAGDIRLRPVPPVLTKQVTCMVGALKAMPKIDRIKSEVVRIGGMPQAFVEYRDNAKRGRVRP